MSACTSVNEVQKKKFDDFSFDWWVTRNPLRTANLFLCDHIVDVVHTKDLKVLDVGCGGGFLTEPLARHGFTVVGIDVSENMIEAARKHANPELNNLSYLHETVEDHAMKNPDLYDVVVLNFVLQHVNNHDIILSSCAKALKPGGLLFVTTAAKTYRGWMNVVILPELMFRYIPRHVNNWNNFIRSTDVEAMLKDNRCIVNDSKGLFYNPLSRKWSWHNNVDGGWYTLHATKDKN